MIFNIAFPNHCTHFFDMVVFQSPSISCISDDACSSMFRRNILDIFTNFLRKNHYQFSLSLSSFINQFFFRNKTSFTRSLWYHMMPPKKNGLNHWPLSLDVPFSRTVTMKSIVIIIPTGIREGHDTIRLKYARIRKVIAVLLSGHPLLRDCGALRDDMRFVLYLMDSNLEASYVLENMYFVFDYHGLKNLSNIFLCILFTLNKGLNSLKI